MKCDKSLSGDKHHLTRMVIDHHKLDLKPWMMIIVIKESDKWPFSCDTRLTVVGVGVALWSLEAQDIAGTLSTCQHSVYIICQLVVSTSKVHFLVSVTFFFVCVTSLNRHIFSKFQYISNFKYFDFTSLSFSYFSFINIIISTQMLHWSENVEMSVDLAQHRLLLPYSIIIFYQSTSKPNQITIWSEIIAN